MNLYLLRHGEAEPRHYDDSLRALTPHGKREVISVAKQFAEHHITLTSCFHSPYTRTTQTCALFVTESGSTIKPEPLSLLTPNHRASQVLAFLRTLQSEHVLVVTHNPLVSELLAVLTDSDIETMYILSTSELNAVQCETCVTGGGVVVPIEGTSVSSTDSPAQELRLQLSNGQECALLMFGPEHAPPVLALHGWQDNAASFYALAAQLPEYRVIALDFPGHGLSARRPLSSPYYIWSYVSEIRGVVEHFGWQHFTLMGHSMGGATACLYAALYPQELSKLVLLDSLGPLVTTAEQLPQQMREALLQLESLRARQRHYYRDFATAVQARADKGLSLEAATLLGQRGVICDEQGCYWSFDPRLRVLNPLSLTEEQVAAFIHQIQCPILLVLSLSFWRTRQAMLHQRLAYLPQAQVHELAGDHHQHMDAQATTIAALIRKFLI